MTMILTGISCQNGTTSGPYFGNGIHNGWADQTSIVIWTRLTQNPELNREGSRFLPINQKRARELDKLGHPDSIHAAQIPEGLTLNDMEGACPGSPGEVKLVYHPIGIPENRIEINWTEVDQDKNYTIQWQLDDLSPNTEYRVTAFSRLNAQSEAFTSIEGAFNTPPDEDTSKEINFCIVTCHDYIRRDDSLGGHRIYPAMDRHQPDFFVHTGDIEYYDKIAPWAMTEDLMYFKWDRLFALPFQRDFYSNTTSYFMKDDHDVLRNDCYPGMRYGTVSFDRGLQIFDDVQFPRHDTHYKTIRWGKDLQIWLMEGRNYRTKNSLPDGPDKTIWGQDQKHWLFKTLKESNATYKLIISPGPILGPDRLNKNDNYSNSRYAYEGDEIREYLNRFDNIFLCNGDRHWQYVTHWPQTHLWEFGTGAGTDQHAGGWQQSDNRPEHRFLRVKGGYLHGRVYQENGLPFILFEHCDVDGQVVHRERFSQ